MTKVDEYRAHLKSLSQWDDYLLKESGLPGPRGNIELAQVVADEGDKQLFLRYLKYSTDIAPTNSPYEFLAFCGVVGLGRLVVEGEHKWIETLRQFAADSRWRIREGVTMALQRLGDANMDQLIIYMIDWSKGTPFEQRAAAAALCEPRFLGQARHARAVLQVLDNITTSIEIIMDRKSKDFQALRKGLGYCWSVAVAALPADGKPLMEKWLVCEDRDIKWVMQENLKKARLFRMDARWVMQWQKK